MTDIVRIGDATLYHADCCDVLPTLPKFDLLLTDPPYGINWRPRVNHIGEDQLWIDEVDFDIREIAASADLQIIWGGNYFADRLAVSAGWLTWCKRPTDSTFNGDSRTYSTTEMAWCNFGKSAFYVQVWDGGKRAGSSENRTFCHPSQKPLELMQWCLDRSKSSETVLDPFMGSGTTGVACAQSGRAFTGIERERKYFDIACERIERAYAQGKLFHPELAKPEQQELIA